MNACVSHLHIFQKGVSRKKMNLKVLIFRLKVKTWDRSNPGKLGKEKRPRDFGFGGNFAEFVNTSSERRLVLTDFEL
jgi:hypothetical protein